MVKGDSDQLSVEGTLSAVGGSTRPVTVTSYNDNSVGGVTGTGSHAPGDWDGIYIDGSSADSQCAAVHYADTDINTASGATAAFRAILKHNTMDITACCWGTSTCSVDAVYTHWGDGTAGPFPASGAWACGAVTVSPWLLTNSNSSSTFSDGNCGGGTTPDMTLSNAETARSQGIASDQITCKDGFQDACQAIQTRREPNQPLTAWRKVNHR